MPSPRDAIVAASLFFALVLGTAILSTLAPPEWHDTGRDSYGVEAFGQRGIHDTLAALGIPVSRQVAPPGPNVPGSTFVLLGPSPTTAGFNSRYLSGLLPWVEAGGRLVIAPLPPVDSPGDEEPGSREGVKPVPWTTALGLEGLSIDDAGGLVPAGRDDDGERSIADQGRELLRGVLGGPEGPGTWVAEAECRGAWSRLGGDVHRITLPARRRLHLVGRAGEETGALRLLAAPGAERETSPGNADPADDVTVAEGSAPAEGHVVIAAEYPRGSGSIVVVADPALVSNRFLARTDNAVAAVRLLAPGAGPVVFDEFFHGIGPRGNVLWLLTRPGFAALATALLASTLLAAWRGGTRLGPPLADRTAGRRGIGEYLEAMGHLLTLGGGDRGRIVADVRDGVLRQLNLEVGIPPEQHDLDRLETALARRDPNRARRVSATIRDVEGMLAASSWTRRGTLHILRRLTQCL